MSKVVSIRLRDQQWERLAVMARRFGRTPSETSVVLLEEALRVAEYGFIQFRDSPVGRQAYIMGTSLAVWEVAFLARYYDGKAEPVAQHLSWPLVKVHAALQYAESFAEEINAAIADNEVSIERLQRALPGLETVTIEP